MKSIFKRLVSAVAALIVVSLACVPACADSAKSGSTVSVTIYVEGVPTASGANITIAYDADYLKYTSGSYNAPYGTSVVNDKDEGTIVWAVIFDAVTGLDFSESTAVFNVRFKATEDISDVESLIEMTVSEAITADEEDFDVSHITMKCVSSDKITDEDNTQSDVESTFSDVSEVSAEEESAISAGGIVLIIAIVVVVVGLSVGIAVVLVRIISKD